MILHPAKVIVSHEKHGQFTTDTRMMEKFAESILGDVNYDRNGRRALAALVTETVDVNYFDADLFTLIAVMVNCGFHTDSLAVYLSQYEDDYVENVWTRFMGDESTR